MSNQDVFHDLRHRNALGMLAAINAFRNDPARAALDASLAKQQGERHPGPFAAGRSPVRLDDIPARTGFGTRTLDVVNPRHVRQTLELFHREDQRAIDHPVDHQLVLARIDIRYAVLVLCREMQRVWRDHSD